jgi:glutathione synthase
VNELGIYGTYLSAGSKDKMFQNTVAGYLLRTKPMDSDEGGVAAGYSVLNSIILTDL